MIYTTRMICYACQNGTLGQNFANTIQCNVCSARWINNMLSGKTEGLSCMACGNTNYKQTYPNIIFCGTCDTKWYNNSLSQFGKSQRGYYASKYRKARP